MTKQILISLGVLVGLSNGVMSQTHVNTYPGAWVAPAHFFHHPAHSATAAESYARGQAALIRAQADYNLLASQTRIQLAEARRLELENHVLRTEAYFRARQINREARGSVRSPGQGTYHLTSRKVAKPAHIKCDLSTGILDWPALLTGDEYRPYRNAVNQIVEERVSRGSLAGDQQMALANATQHMATLLREQIRDVSVADYMDARHFLRDLLQQSRSHFN